MNRARLLTDILPDSAGDLMKGGRMAADANAPQRAQDLLNLQYLRDKFGVDIQGQLDKLKNTQGILGIEGGNMMQDAAILGGGSLALTGVAGLGGAEGGDAIASGALGAGIPAAMAYARKRGGRPVNGRDLVGLMAAGAGAGAGSSMLLDALGI